MSQLGEEIPGGMFRTGVAVFLVCLSALLLGGWQSAGTGGILQGTVTDQTGAVIPNAKIEIKNPVTNYQGAAESDAAGNFTVRNVPFNHYHVTATAQGFAKFETDIEVRSAVPVTLPVTLSIAASATEVTVEAGAEDLIDKTPTAHTDVDQSLLQQLPTHSVSSRLSSAITLATPGVVADSNGMFHPLGEHSDTSFSVDNQPITDQQSKTFSNQISTDSIQSMEVISGVPPAEFGDKNSLVVRVTSKSGLGVKQLTGNIGSSYGSFGTAGAHMNLLAGGDKWGNFFTVDGLNSGRFLDSPEFRPLHDKGNQQNFFDRIDFQPNSKDTLHLNLNYARSWFQIPNQYDQQLAGQDQRQLMNTYNIAPGWTHLFSDKLMLTTTAWVRQDRIHYYPSADSFSDQPATLAQNRRLTNTGARVDLSYVKGHHNAKIGFEFGHTFLSEFFQLGVTSPTLNALCVDSSGVPVAAPGIVDPAACAGAGFIANPNFSSGLLPFDLTRGGVPFVFQGHADIKQEALYLQDAVTLGDWTLNLGVRGDKYNGLSSGGAIQPRVGAAYHVRKTNTVLRGSYGRLFETPYNENLVLSSSTGAGGLAAAGGAFGTQPIKPGFRQQFNTGFQQGLGKFAVVDAEYFWKFTHTAYDFDTLFNSPLTFPISWRQSRIDGFSIRVTLPTWHGLSAFTAMGHTRARFFGPENGGILFNSPINFSVFRIDHDQVFEETTSLNYRPFKYGPSFGFVWRYDSGEVAGAVPDLTSLLALSSDQQQQAGLFCGNTFATFGHPITSCSQNLGSTRLVIPGAGGFDADKNPTRIVSRNLFDASIGFENIFRGDRYKWNLRLTGVNLTNQVSLYNFLSTFSGTHFVTPRTYTAELGFNF